MLLIELYRIETGEGVQERAQHRLLIELYRIETGGGLNKNQ